jgi:hypothetical protein
VHGEGGALWRPLRRHRAPGDRRRAARSGNDSPRGRAGRRRGHGRAEHLDEARADVERAITALHAEGHFRALGPDLQIEYAVAGLAEGGRLLCGFVDWGATAERLDVIDFKTDAPPRESRRAGYPVSPRCVPGALYRVRRRRDQRWHRAPQRRRRHPLGLTGSTKPPEGLGPLRAPRDGFTQATCLRLSGNVERHCLVEPSRWWRWTVGR